METRHRRFTTQVTWKKGPIVGQLVTHIPDCVVHLDHSKKLPHFNHFDGVVLFADVSGFTSLCEKYTMSGTKSGIDQLTKTLNGYIGALVDRILSADGDVLEYAGDAILAIFTVEDSSKLQGALHRAVKCAVSIQRNYSEWETDVGVILKVKIGISAGEVCITYVGNDEFRHYIAAGKAVEDVNIAETYCQSGYIVVSPYAWNQSSEKMRKDLIHEFMQDGRHVRVWEGFGGSSSGYSLIRTVKPSDAQKEVKAQNLGEKLKKLLQEGQIYSGSGVMSIGPRCEYGNKYRKSLLVPEDDILKSRLKLYIVKPVTKKLDDDQPLQYLSEVREVTIMFTNLSLHDRMTHDEMAKVLQETFDVIYGICTPLGGCLNKIFAFDKDAKAVNFLTIFGLPGYKHENDCQHALHAAAQVHTTCVQVTNVDFVSIGVTTGATFCGVIGHKHRQEYTVIGRKVNMAARFMMHYPHRVVCDKETFYNSRLPRTQFKELESKVLKGLQNVGTIREFIGSGDVASGTQKKYKKNMYPLLGRKREFEVVKRQILWKRDGGGEAPLNMGDIIVIEGDTGMGKSRLLADILTYSDEEEKIGVFYCQCTMNSMRVPYFTVRSLLAEMLGLDMTMHHQEREQKLIEMFSHQEIKDALFLLNDIFHVKFPVMEDSVYSQREHGTMDLIERIIYEASSKHGFMLFAIDDASYMDKESTAFLIPLCLSAVSMLLMTKRKSKEADDSVLFELTRLLPEEARKCCVITIGGLEPSCLASLACQMLGVLKIPRQLAEILVTKSNGVAQWCEELLREMLSDNLIKIVEDDDKYQDMVTPSPHDITRKNDDATDVTPPLTPKESQSGGERLSGKGEKSDTEEREGEEEGSSQGSSHHIQRRVCIIDPENMDKLETVQIPDSIKALILSRIDQMNEADQLTIKCASVLGKSFQIDLLDAVIPSKDKQDLQSSIIRLFKIGIFACGSQIEYKETGESGNTLPTPVLCHCYPGKPTEDYANCKQVVFRSGTMQETAYEILLEDQKIHLHNLAAVFLETKVFKCQYCGGGDIVPYRMRLLSMAGSELQVGKSELFAALSRTEHTQSVRSRVRRLSTAQTMKAEGSDPKIRPTSSKKSNRVAPIEEDEEKADNEEEKKPTGEAIDATLDIAARSSRRKSCIQDFLGLAHMENIDTTKVLSVEEENAYLIDFEQTECECNSVLRYVYPELVRHWRYAGDVKNTIYSLLHAAAAEISVNQLTEALAYLDEVDQVMHDLKNDQNPFENVVSVIKNTVLTQKAEAILCKLRGQALVQMGKRFQSEVSFKRALKLWKKSQPSNIISCSFKIMIESFKQRRNRRHQEKLFKAQESVDGVMRLTEIVRCLYHLYQIHMSQYCLQEAYLDALQQLNLAEKSNISLSSVISAYTCLIEICTARNNKQMAIQYEKIAVDRINESISDLSPDDVLSISCLHAIMMQTYLNSGMLKEACEAGEKVVRITQRIHAPDVVLHILPSLAEALLFREETSGCIRVLKNIQVIAEELRDKIGLAYYYIGSISLVLYTGHILEDPEVCNDFFLELWSHPILGPERVLRFTIAITMCLWYTRTGSVLKAESWYLRAEEVMPGLESFRTFSAGLAYSKVVECQLIRMSQFSISSSRPELIEWKVQLKDLLKAFNKVCSHVEILMPRKFHMEAFCHAIAGNDKAAKASLDTCLAKCDKMNAVFDKAWAEHNQKIWLNDELRATQEPFWSGRWGRDPLQEDILDEVVDTDITIHFSLPLPDYFAQESIFVDRDITP